MHRRNRVTIALLALLVGVGSLLAVLQGAGAFGRGRADEAVFDATVARWWDQGDSWSFLVAGAIGLVILIFGVNLARWQFSWEGSRRRASTLVLADGRGSTRVRVTALTHGLELDLARVPGVSQAVVALYQPEPDHPNVGVRAALTVEDGTDLDGLPGALDACAERFRAMTGRRLQAEQVTIRFAP